MDYIYISQNYILMKRILIIIALIICSLHSICQINYTERFLISEFDMRDTLCPDNQTYTYFPAFLNSSTTQPGQPALPFVSIKILIPTESKIDSIKIIDGDTSILLLDHRIFPAQSPIPTCIDCKVPGFSSIDSSVYYSTSVFPSDEPGTNIGYWYLAQIITIDVIPFRYYPMENKLVFCTSKTIIVYYSDNNGNNGTQTVKMVRSFHNYFVSELSAIIKNPEMIDSFISNIEVIKQKDQSSSTVPNMDYVVVVPDNFVNSIPLNKFVDWKKRKGVNITAVSLAEVYNYVNINNTETDNIGNNYPVLNSQDIAGNAAKIRMYLKSVSSNGGCKYVLLVGDASRMPTRTYYAEHGYFSGTTPTYAISDKYFADYNSDYAVDGDSRYGEITQNLMSPSGDKVDLYPESYVGRIPCANLEEFGIWVDKLINYETNPGDGDASYLNGFVMTMADGPQNSIGTTTFNNLNIFDPLKVFKELPSFNHQAPTESDGAAIISYFNTSPAGWWTWDNHGLPSHFATKTQGDNGSLMSSINCYNTTNGLLSLFNDNKYGIVSSNCCDIANFNASENMLDAAIFNSNGGAVAMAGNTDLGWYPTGEYKLGALTSVLKACHMGTNQTQTRYCTADWAWYVGKSPYYDYYYNYETYLTNNYFGDPEMMYYTKEPERFIAEVTPRHIGLDEDNLIVVTIKNLAYLQKATVCLYQTSANGGEYQVIKEIDGVHGDETATFNIPAITLNTGVLYVTVSGFNFMPFTDEILVSPGCTKNTNPLVITTTPALPWGDRFINQDVTVNSGVSLTITGKVYFVQNCKITIMPGAKLIIDGGTLASSCEALWEGIDIVGHSNLTQYSSTNQGFVQITNSGSIQDAICALRTAQTNTLGFIAGTTGGTFSCTNARFLNNLCSIRVYPYQFANYNYNSNISRCEFMLDDNYIPTRYAQNSAMICYQDIKSIGNSGLTFKNTMTEDDVTYRGIGILATNAGLGLNQICDSPNNIIPCNHYRRPYFEGLYYGIICRNIGASKFVLVGNSDFTNNTRGIYLSAVNNPSITRCTFKTKAQQSFGLLTNSSGLYFDNLTTGYSIQENIFEGNYSGIALTYETGIIINNSGTAPNEIYSNSFTGLQNGILAQNQNRDATGEYGLSLKCNDFFSPNKFDIAVTKDNTNSGNGIKRIQGVDGSQTTDPAGNTFSYTHQNSESDYHNECENITYIYHAVANGANVNPVNHTPQPIVSTIATTSSLYSYNKLSSCPSHLDNGGGGISQFKLQQDGAEALISNYTGQMLNLKDGGNTQELKEDIAYSIPTEALALYNSLMAESPYLSDSVMVEAIGKEDVLPSAMVSDILVANPQSAKSSEVNEALDSRTNLLSDEQRVDVDQGVFVLSAFESLQSKLSDALAQRAQLQYAIVNHYLNDSTGTDSLKIYLAAQPDIWAKQLLLMQYLAEKDTLAADALLQTFPINSYNPSQQTEWNDLAEYYSLSRQIAANENNLPDSVQLTALAELAAHHTHAAAYARNLLINQGMIVYNEPYIFPDDNLKSGKVIRRNQGFGKSDIVLKVYPNPATDYIIAEYNFDEHIKKPLLNIIDVLGRNLHSVTLSSNKGFEVIPLINMPPGIYTITLCTNSTIIKKAKVIVCQ
jgi:hypothetical protein